MKNIESIVANISEEQIKKAQEIVTERILDGKIVLPKEVGQVSFLTHFQRWEARSMPFHVAHAMKGYYLELALAAAILQNFKLVREVLVTGMNNCTNAEYQKYHGEYGCCCEVAYDFIYHANYLGQPQLASYLASSIRCPGDPRYYEGYGAFNDRNREEEIPEAKVVEFLQDQAARL